MECPKKKQSSYQTLKDDYNAMYEMYSEKKEENQAYKNVLWAIALMKGAEVVNAPRLALEALNKYEKK